MSSPLVPHVLCFFLAEVELSQPSSMPVVSSNATGWLVQVLPIWVAWKTRVSSMENASCLYAAGLMAITEPSDAVIPDVVLDAFVGTIVYVATSVSSLTTPSFESRPELAFNFMP
mmetsp:Transcript_11951/g.21889  ORF Transcript_11951/g.21889 Transcript_11951/m.21889 type:complete len:115 (+) Transcript_11951:1642-1986(+)